MSSTDGSTPKEAWIIYDVSLVEGGREGVPPNVGKSNERGQKFSSFVDVLYVLLILEGGKPPLYLSWFGWADLYNNMYVCTRIVRTIGPRLATLEIQYTA